MESWQIALLTVAALVVGAAIPVLWQLRSTLRALEQRVTNLATPLDSAAEDARVTARRVRLVTDAIHGREAALGDNVAHLVESAGNLAGALDRLQGTAHTATAVGAAVAAGVRAFRDVRRSGAGGAEEETRHPDGPAADPPEDDASRSAELRGVA